MKIDQLTCTRFVAALLVILFHHHKVNNFILHANVFVSYFYILSGFVLVVSQKKQFAKRAQRLVFYLFRFARIYPVYLLSTLLFVVAQKQAGWDVILNIMAVQAFFPAHALSYNFPSWSISVELFFYYCFPFLVYYFFNRLSLKQVLATTFFFWFFCQVVFLKIYHWDGYAQSETAQNFLWYNPLNHFNEFVTGGALALLFKKKYEQWKGNYDAVLVALATLIFCYLSYWKPLVGLFDHNGLLMILFGPFIFFLSLNTGFITQLFKNPMLVLAGEISFGLYILAEPFFLGLYKVSLKFSMPALVNLWCALPLLLVVSYLSYMYLEKPAQNFIKRWGIKRITQKKEPLLSYQKS